MNKGYSRQLQSNYRLQQQAADGSTLADVPFTEADLADSLPPKRYRRLKGLKPLAVLAFCACSGAAVMLGTKSVSKPLLSAADIIQMDGYGGRQNVPELVTIQSLSGPALVKETGEVLEISARNLAPMAKTIAPQIIDNHFNSQPPVIAANREIRMRVQQQWSNLRATPAINGAIITSLDRREIVTVLEQTDRWMRVVTDQNQHGYMHRSVLRAN